MVTIHTGWWSVASTIVSINHRHIPVPLIFGTAAIKQYEIEQELSISHETLLLSWLHLKMISGQTAATLHAK